MFQENLELMEKVGRQFAKQFMFMRNFRKGGNFLAKSPENPKIFHLPKCEFWKFREEIQSKRKFLLRKVRKLRYTFRGSPFLRKLRKLLFRSPLEISRCANGLFLLKERKEGGVMDTAVGRTKAVT